MAAQFQRLGLKPAGANGSYEQLLEFTESSDALDASVLKIHGVLTPPEFAAINDILARPSAGQEAGRVRAPAVFIGFGVRAPELGYDDLGDVDLRAFDARPARRDNRGPGRFHGQPRSDA